MKRILLAAAALAGALWAGCDNGTLDDTHVWVKIADTDKSTLITGIAAIGTDIYVAGGANKDTRILYSLSGGSLGTIATYTKIIAGLGSDGTNLWVASPGDGTIKELTTAGGVLDSFNNPNTTNSTGLCYSGGYLWNTGFTGEIYKIDLSGSLISTITSPITNMEGLVIVDGLFYVEDIDNSKILILSASGTKQGEIAIPITAPTALGYDGTYLYIGGQPGSGIYRYKL